MTGEWNHKKLHNIFGTTKYSQDAVWWIVCFLYNPRKRLFASETDMEVVGKVFWCQYPVIFYSNKYKLETDTHKYSNTTNYRDSCCRDIGE